MVTTDEHRAESLGEALPREQARVRGLKATYFALPGGAGWPAAAFMEVALQRADQAVMSGDVVEMLRAHEELKGFTE